MGAPSRAMPSGGRAVSAHPTQPPNEGPGRDRRRWVWGQAPDGAHATGGQTVRDRQLRAAGGQQRHAQECRVEGGLRPLVPVPDPTGIAQTVDPEGSTDGALAGNRPGTIRHFQAGVVAALCRTFRRVCVSATTDLRRSARTSILCRTGRTTQRRGLSSGAGPIPSALRVPRSFRRR